MPGFEGKLGVSPDRTGGYREVAGGVTECGPPGFRHKGRPIKA